METSSTGSGLTARMTSTGASGLLGRWPLCDDVVDVMASRGYGAPSRRARPKPKA